MRRTRRPGLAAVLSFLLVACGGDGGGGGGPSPTATVSGTVRDEGTAAALAGASVTVAGRTVTTDQAGRYEVADLAIATVDVRVTRDGYDPYEAQVALDEGANTLDVALGTQTVFRSGAAAVYIPRDVAQVRTVFLLLGGPDTRAVATGDLDGLTAVELVNVPKLRDWFLPLASEYDGAIIGLPEGQPDAVATDAIILDALAAIAQASGHPELATAPFLVLGVSGGAPAAYGFTRRQPERVAGMLLRVPATLSSDRSAAAQAVPGYILLAANEQLVSNAQARAFFEANRLEGARWSLAVEPGVGHYDLSTTAIAAMREWAVWALVNRVPAAPASPASLVAIAEEASWLGNRTDGIIAAWAAYTGERRQASWLPSQATAESWRALSGLGN